jgi:hypothetical protein
MAEVVLQQKKEALKLPEVVLNKKQKKKLIINISGRLKDFAEGKASVTFKDVKDILAPSCKSPTIQRMIPIKICAYNLKHNLPISIVPDIPLANSAFVGADGKKYQAVIGPDSTVKRVSLMEYENKIDERELLAFGKITPEILGKQFIEIQKLPNIVMITPWLYGLIVANQRTLEMQCGRRVSVGGVQIDPDVPLYPMDKIITEMMVKIMTDNLKRVPFTQLGKDLTIKFEPYGQTWKQVLDEWSQAESEAEAAFLNMPYTITGVVKYVYAVLD